jgi:hypothetical protein
MFINHSCDPNCETDERNGQVWIKAIKNIAAGSEITYDYCLYDGGDEPAICNCGSKNCRGTMYSPEEMRRRKKRQKAEAAGTARGRAKPRHGSRAKR